MKKVIKDFKLRGSVKDRGNIKWQGMFLTEHVKLLREMEEESRKMPQPNLDEYDLQLIQEEVELALRRKCDIIVHTWKDGKVTRHHGTMVGVDEKREVLIYEDPFKQRAVILNEIVSIKLID